MVMVVARKTGAASIADLRKLAPGQLPAGFGSGAAWPIFDGFVIPDDQHKLSEAGQYNDVAILLGYNSDEGLSLLSGADAAGLSCEHAEALRSFRRRCPEASGSPRAVAQIHESEWSN